MGRKAEDIVQSVLSGGDVRDQVRQAVYEAPIDFSKYRGQFSDKESGEQKARRVRAVFERHGFRRVHWPTPPGVESYQHPDHPNHVVHYLWGPNRPEGAPDGSWYHHDSANVAYNSGYDHISLDTHLNQFFGTGYDRPHQEVPESRHSFAERAIQERLQRSSKILNVQFAAGPIRNKETEWYHKGSKAAREGEARDFFYQFPVDENLDMNDPAVKEKLHRIRQLVRYGPEYSLESPREKEIWAHRRERMKDILRKHGIEVPEKPEKP